MNIKNLFITPAAIVALGLTSYSYGQWQLMENFEDEDTSRWEGDSQLLQAGIHSEFQGAYNIVPDPIGGNNSFVGQFSGGPAEGDNFGLPGAVAHSFELPQPIEPDQKATIYFQLGINSFNSDNAFGLTHRPQWVQFWGDMETVMRYEWTNATFDLYNTSGFETFGFPELNLWYEVWKVVDPANLSYEVYIKGGQDYPVQTKIMTFEGNETFRFRNRSQEALVRFGIIHNINSIEVPFPRDPMYLDNMYVDYSGENLATPDGLELIAPEQWAGLNIDAFGYVGTADFLGRLYVGGEGDWVYVDDWASWAFLKEDDYDQWFGTWLYVPALAGDLSLPSGPGLVSTDDWLGTIQHVGEDVYYVFETESWLWIPQGGQAETGAWVYAIPPYFDF